MPSIIEIPSSGIGFHNCYCPTAVSRCWTARIFPMYGIFILCARSTGSSWLRHGPFVATYVTFAHWSSFFLVGTCLFSHPPPFFDLVLLLFEDWFILPGAFASGIVPRLSWERLPPSSNTRRRGPAPLAIWIALAGSFVYLRNRR